MHMLICCGREAPSNIRIFIFKGLTAIDSLKLICSSLLAHLCWLWFTRIYDCSIENVVEVPGPVHLKLILTSGDVFNLQSVAVDR